MESGDWRIRESSSCLILRDLGMRAGSAQQAALASLPLTSITRGHHRHWFYVIGGKEETSMKVIQLLYEHLPMHDHDHDDHA